jgi:hypothetical protein
MSSMGYPDRKVEATRKQLNIETMKDLGMNVHHYEGNGGITFSTGK